MRRLPHTLIAAAVAAFAGAAPAQSQTAYVPVTDGTNRSILTINTNSFAVGSLGTSIAFNTGIAVTPDGSTLYVTTTDNTVTAIDAVTGAVTATIPVGSNPIGLAITPDGTKVYVANAGLPIPGPPSQLGTTVSVIDTVTNSVAATLPVGREPSSIAITPDGRTAYVANTFDSTISVIDVATEAVSGPISTGPSLLGVKAQGIAISPDGTKLYASGLTDITVFDTATNMVVATIPSGSQPDTVAFSPDGNTAYVPAEETNTPPFFNAALFTIDTVSGTVTHQIPLINTPAGLAPTPDGKEVLIVGIDKDSVQVVSTGLNAFTSAIPLPPEMQFSIGSISIGAAPSLVAAMLPSGRSVETGTTATMFATLLNASPSSLQNCRIGLRGPVPAAVTVGYQTTDPVTNAVTGQPNQPVTIAGNGSQTFVLSVSSTAALSLPADPLLFLCDGLLPAPVISGVNTADLLFSATPIADVVALAATASNDGVVTVPQSQNADGAFALASVNVGATDTLTVSADTGTATLPVSVTLCQTDPSTSQCLAPPAPTVTLSDAANATPTFSFFVDATAPIAFAPATARVFVHFKDAGGVSHGSTSVAVKTS
jgi:YVTN family beta-propeller protein